MKHYGITGIIGSGKSTIAKVLEWLGGSLFDSDSAAKYLMENNLTVRKELVNLFGKEVFWDEKLNRNLIREKIFTDNELQTKINMLIHPLVWQEYLSWREKQNTSFTLMESALLLKNKRTDFFESIIYVESDIELCIERVTKRSNLTRKVVENIIKNQIVDFEEFNNCKLLHINNNGTELVLTQCYLLKKIL